MYVGFASSTCAFASFLFRKPCILLDDTEHNAMNHRLYMPFCSAVLTPFYFKDDLSKFFGGSGKQIYFNAYVEQLYLHSKYYQTSTNVLDELGVEKGKYVIVRYTSYDAHHDIGVKHLEDEFKKSLLQRMEQSCRVLLSLENPTDDDDYNKYLFSIAPEQIHDIEANAKFMLSEGGTMINESFVLGVPCIHINPLMAGCYEYMEKNFSDRFLHSIDEQTIITKIDKWLSSETKPIENRKSLEANTICPTDLLVWFVENYPESMKTMQNNPDYQNNFK